MTPAKTMRISRRRWIVVSAAAALSCGSLAALRACHYPGEADTANLENLSRRHAIVLAAVTVTMLPPSPAVTPTVVRRVVRDIDAYLTGLRPGDVEQFRQLLTFVEQATPLFGGRLDRFSRLASVDRARVIQSLQTSRFELPRLGFRSLKALVFLAYYRDATAWSTVGYEGPHRPAGVLSPELEAKYAKLIAAPRTRPA